ncbi:hypothetical protein FM109_05195 [Vibrio casei]|nr:hypothetical protein FM109_05195 [Vibrio casei]
MGTSVGQIDFANISLKKINFNIISSNGTPSVAEFETY